MKSKKIRFGILGAAAIAPAAIIDPARKMDEVEIAAIAARDPEKAAAFARRHGIPRVHRTYADLVADPEIDALYNPLPNSLHGEWSIRALEAGKHVLCEKPVACNADEADAMARAANKSGRTLMEAFHYRYHPMMLRIMEIVRSGEIGTIRSIRTNWCFPLLKPDDIRYRYDLAGGSTMDIGCYCIHFMRTIAGGEPAVVSARAKCRKEQIDRWMQAEFAFPGGVSASMTCAMLSATPLRLSATITGTGGAIRLINPFIPHLLWHRIKVLTNGKTRVEKIDAEPTYAYQLRAFADRVLRHAPLLNDTNDAIANMRAIDAVYRAAGLKRRGE